MSQTYDKPLPTPTIESKPYWDGLNEGRLLIQTCADCGKLRHYPRPVCDACYSMEVEWTEASGKGTLYSWTETHHPFHVGFRGDLPYILATVDLDEGVRLQCRLIGAKLEDLKLGQKVEVVFERVTDEVTLPMVRLAE